VVLQDPKTSGQVPVGVTVTKDVGIDDAKRKRHQRREQDQHQILLPARQRLEFSLHPHAWSHAPHTPQKASQSVMAEVFWQLFTRRTFLRDINQMRLLPGQLANGLRRGTNVEL
jgi:hypothetical protein